ncbi:tRNA (adenosine(37)-N6)-threonylcarbamoyltransferase complex transferase subunit TsaD [candidate division WOR-3 bacterium]|nr:tRNA (adenosine(37)-N6)-threonylcarbamoyltransferase complex transferase subunit TsaD [candidate division WOR-3 bacterium]
MITLGIETSCDETAIGVLDDDTVLANVVSSQVAHSKYGGVVPELAARNHIKVIVPLTKIALEIAHLDAKDVDLIAATYGPGLVGALLVGLSFAKSLSISLCKPYIGVNHLEGHVYALHEVRKDMPYPMLVLIVSGGHTEIIRINNEFEYETLGRTLDDACGEAFDKVAKIMGLPYPGGPYIEKHAVQGSQSTVSLPVPRPKPFHFSYAGLKTAVLYYTRENPEYSREDVAAAFQEAALDHLVEVVEYAVVHTRIKNLGIVGGVSANARLREKFSELARRTAITLYIPEILHCTDNGVMIALAGAARFVRFGRSPLCLDAVARESLDTISSVKRRA